MKKRILAFILCIAMCLGTVSVLAGCGGDETPDSTPGSTPSSTPGSTPSGDGGNGDKENQKTDTLVLMSEELDGLFNPFYGTTGADNTITAMTQIGMLTSKYVKGEDGKESVEVAFGDNEAVVVKDYESKYNKDLDETVYTFVIKNGIKFSNGSPLTMRDILFNLYVYLDPVYAGSSTMYSTKIKGLTSYRTQVVDSGDSGSDADSQINEQAASRANERVNALVNLFRQIANTQTAVNVTEKLMKDKINSLTETEIGEGYKTAVTHKPESLSHDQWKAQLIKDYEYILKLYKEELESAYATAKEAFTEAPYKGHTEFEDQIFCFMYSQGYVETTYVQVNGKDDKSQIDKLTKLYGTHIDTKEEAIEYAFGDTIARQLDIVLYFTSSAQTVLNEYISNAKGVILHEQLGDDNSLAIDHIEGIVSLGHLKENKPATVVVNGTTYNVATGHDEKTGVVTKEGEYDVLQITIEGVDPKAVWNFAFSVAPQYYYGEGSSVGVDIENNKFGVEWGSFDFMTKIVQSPRNIKLPVGAGAYKVTNRANEDDPTGLEFFSDNIVYFKANNYFETVGAGINNAKIEKVRYQVVSASNALSALESGSIHYATPQLTESNYVKIESMASMGIDSKLVAQLGYGYIGVNASKVKDINLRKAIMCAMNTALALDYYRPGTAARIFWPMSKVSWAYPQGESHEDNGKDYPQVGLTFSTEIAKENILNYMSNAGVSEGDSSLKLTFTIAGSNLTDHPTYKVFRDAAALLNSLGWNITVQADTQALTKLSTGSLTVWAAAWGSTIDPDLYQVYHKNSTATSTLAWGYPTIKTEGSDYEKGILDDLSDLIEEARETDNQATRTEIYEEAMGLILELAIELPVYQRSTIYVYNANVIDKNSLPEDINPYSSPLDRIWEIEFAK